MSTVAADNNTVHGKGMGTQPMYRERDTHAVSLQQNPRTQQPHVFKRPLRRPQTHQQQRRIHPARPGTAATPPITPPLTLPTCQQRKQSFSPDPITLRSKTPKQNPLE